MALFKAHHNRHSTSRNHRCRIGVTLALADCLASSSAHAALVGFWDFNDQDLDESFGFRADGVHDGVAGGDTIRGRKFDPGAFKSSFSGLRNDVGDCLTSEIV